MEISDKRFKDLDDYVNCATSELEDLIEVCTDGLWKQQLQYVYNRLRDVELCLETIKHPEFYGDD